MPSSVWRSWRCYLVPVILSVVALVQFYRVHTEALTRWKGGGFGMYSEFHATKRQVFYTDTNGRYLWQNEAFADPNVRLRTFPNESVAAEVSAELSVVVGQPVSVQVWEPVFDVETMEMRRVPILVYIPNSGGGQE